MLTFCSLWRKTFGILFAVLVLGETGGKGGHSYTFAPKLFLFVMMETTPQGQSPLERVTVRSACWGAYRHWSDKSEQVLGGSSVCQVEHTHRAWQNQYHHSILSANGMLVWLQNAPGSMAVTSGMLTPSLRSIFGLVMNMQCLVWGKGQIRSIMSLCPMQELLMFWSGRRKSREQRHQSLNSQFQDE